MECERSFNSLSRPARRYIDHCRAAGSDHDRRQLLAPLDQTVYIFRVLGRRGYRRGVTVRVPQRGERRVAGMGMPDREIEISGRMFGAEEAWEAGIVTRLAEEGGHVRAAEPLAREILQNPRPAVREHVRVRRTVAAEAVTHHVDLTRNSRGPGRRTARRARRSSPARLK